MSVNTAPVGRLRLPEIASVVALAVVGALTVAVLALVDATRTGSHQEVSATVAEDMPTPAWLQRYLDYEAPAANDMPTPEWLKRYLQLGAAEGLGPTVPVDTGVGRPVNEGLR